MTFDSKKEFNFSRQELLNIIIADNYYDELTNWVIRKSKYGFCISGRNKKTKISKVHRAHRIHEKMLLN